MRSIFPVVAALLFTTGLVAQSAAPNAVGLLTDASIAAQVKELLPKAAASPNGEAGVKMGDHPGLQLLLWVRSGKDGVPGGESHAAFTDYNVVVEGEATMVTGGTIVNPKEVSPGEIRGTEIVGGTPHLLHKGDILHVPAGTPHQTIVAPGKTFAYLTLKIALPQP